MPGSTTHPYTHAPQLTYKDLSELLMVPYHQLGQYKLPAKLQLHWHAYMHIGFQPINNNNYYFNVQPINNYFNVHHIVQLIRTPPLII